MVKLRVNESHAIHLDEAGQQEEPLRTIETSPNRRAKNRNSLFGSAHKHVAAPYEAPHGGGAPSSLSSSTSSSKLNASSHHPQPHHHQHHHYPSFRVIGVQLSHLTRTGQFVFCTLGVFFFLLIYGFLQEYIVIHVFNRKLGIFLTLCQFSGYSLFAALHRVIHEDVPRRIPLAYYILLATLQATMQGLTNLSMRWLNYPAKMLFKSSRVIPTMMVGIFYMKKRYKSKDYAVVALMSLGLVSFMKADVKVSPSFHPLGILFICLALAVDAAIVNLQEYTLRKYDASHDELIFYSYGFGSMVLLFFSLVTMELGEGIAFLHRQGATATCCLVIFCSCGYFGVTCVAALTKKFGALASTMTTTARKALTLFLSFFLFPKPATLLHVLGGLLFVAGLSLKAIPTSSKKQHNNDAAAAASLPLVTTTIPLAAQAARPALSSRNSSLTLASTSSTSSSLSMPSAGGQGVGAGWVATEGKKKGTLTV